MSRLVRRVVVVGIFALMSVVAGPLSAGAKPPRVTPEERAAALARPAVVYVEIDWHGIVRDLSDGQFWLDGSSDFTSGCSGFVVSPDGYVVTAGHCVDPGVDGIAPEYFQEIIDVFNSDPANGPAPTFEALAAGSVVEGDVAGSPPDRQIFVQRGVATSGLKSGEAKPARLVGFVPFTEGDVAILKIEAQDLSAVELAPRSSIQIGTPILAIGYPASADAVSDATLEPTNKDGKVSANRTIGGLPFYEVSAATTQGMSGGPVIDRRGRVVGIVSRAPADEPQAFNFIVTSSIVREQLAQNAVKARLGKVDRLYRAALKTYFGGDFEGAIKAFDKVLDLDPSHQQAQEFRRNAARRRS